jgi:hypothetical protein
VEYLRVSIEGIITKWKGSLYVTDDEGGYSPSAKYTVLSYNHDDQIDQSTFRIPTAFIDNKFDLIYNNLGGLILDTTNISNIALNYNNYEIKNEYGNFELIQYEGSTENTNPYITVVTKGNPFPTLTGSTFGTFKYHLKPKDSVIENLFFSQLDEFENILLNRLITPKYTSTFEAPLNTDSGTILLSRQSFTWPTTDGFNIDVDTIEYGNYINDILGMAKNYDNSKGNLMSRRFVSSSIHEYDTDDGTNDESQGRKINKTIKIYGRQFDEIKKYTDGIKFANVVTYDKRNNTPDELIKVLAKTMGFDAIKSVSDNKLLSYIAKSNQSTFSGQSRSMSVQEIDTELWRRLVINAWWLYKSKGTRKVIEFFINLFGLGECLVNFDEVVYVASHKLNVEQTFDKIGKILTKDLGDIEPVIDRTEYPIDEQGFPKTLPNTDEYYFQMNGFWYNGGTEKTVGNNPHSGPYDYGSKYFEKFSCFIDDLPETNTVTVEEFTETLNLFPDYNNGDAEITFEGGKPVMDYGNTYGERMMSDGRVSSEITMVSAGFTTENSRTGRGSIKMTFNTGDVCSICPTYQLNQKTGLITPLQGDTPINNDCCTQYGFNYKPIRLDDMYGNFSGENGQRLNDKYVDAIVSSYGQRFYDDNNRGCFWCRKVTPMCDIGVSIEWLSNNNDLNRLIDFLIDEGILTENNRKQFTKEWNDNKQRTIDKVSEQLEEKYNGYCLVIHEDLSSVSNACCRVRGGDWVDINQNQPSDVPNYKCVVTKEVIVEDKSSPCEMSTKRDATYAYAEPGLLRFDGLTTSTNPTNLLPNNNERYKITIELDGNTFGPFNYQYDSGVGNIITRDGDFKLSFNPQPKETMVISGRDDDGNSDAFGAFRVYLYTNYVVDPNPLNRGQFKDIPLIVVIKEIEPCGLS